MYMSKEIAQVIDHALLSPVLTQHALDKGLDDCLELQPYSVCVKSCDVEVAWKKMWEPPCHPVKVCSVVGFPHGNTRINDKRNEAQHALGYGASEIDYVVNLSRVASGDWSYVELEMEEMVSLIKCYYGAKLKCIFECCYLTDDMKRMLCYLACKTGVDFVKTSTGFGIGGATAKDVNLMKNEVTYRSNDKCLVKASGGIKTLEDLEFMLACGASRIGTSSTRAIIEQAKKRAESANV